MNISNLDYTPPTNVRNYFYNCIPFGSDYVIYTSQYQSGASYIRKYDLVIHKLGSSNYQHIQATVTPNSTTYSDLSGGSYDSFVVSSPAYAYTNIPRQGIQETTLPCVNNTMCFMLIILASVAVVKMVFGGIVKLWGSRKKDIYS